MSTDVAEMANNKRMLEWLAVLGNADQTTLEALWHEDAFHDSDWAALTARPEVVVEDGRYQMTDEAAAEILAALSEADGGRYRQMHLAALDYLAARLQTDQPALEAQFVTLFARLADHLLQVDSGQFSALISQFESLSLADRFGRQLLHYYRGLSAGLQEQYDQALQIFDQLLAEYELDQRVHGRTLNSRAVFCRITGRLEKAITGYRASLQIWRQLGESLREGMALLNLGILAYQLRAYDDAEASLTQAKRCFEALKSAHWLAAADNELGLVYRDKGEWTAALRHFEAAVTQWQAEGAEDYYGRGLNNVGEILLFQGQLTEAAATFEQALAAMQTRLYTIDTYLNLGLAYQAAHQFEQAKQAYQTALDRAQEIGRKDILAQIYYRLGEVQRHLGDKQAALTQFEAAAAVIEATREPLEDEDLKIGLLGRWQQIYEALVLLCLDLDRPVEAFAWAERARARAFADAIARQNDSPVPASDVAKSTTVAEIKAALPANHTLLSFFTTGVLAQDLPLLQALTQDNPLRDHLLTPARTLCFVVKADSFTVQVCPIDPNAFTSTSYRQNDRSQYLAQPVLRQFYRVLLEPIERQLQTEHLILIPHGPLHHVPFAALLDGQNEALQRAAGPHLTYAPSATILLRRRSRSRESLKPCLAIGYNGPADGRMLRHTETEATFVAGLTEGEAWVGAGAKRTQLKAKVAGQRWLHFACHGRFNYEQPLESYLEVGQDERLTAVEILQDWQLAAELVTLSACQTGISRVLRGDESMGLIRAFLYAGAKAVLVTQWPVEDLPTFLLMQRFYGALQSGFGDPAAALHQAQLWLRQLSRTKVEAILASLPQADLPDDTWESLEDRPADQPLFAHPRYWAAFILVGQTAG